MERFQVVLLEIERLNKLLQEFIEKWKRNNEREKSTALEQILQENKIKEEKTSNLLKQLQNLNNEIEPLHNNSVLLNMAPQNDCSALVSLKKENKELNSKLSDLKETHQKANADIERLKRVLKKFDEDSYNPTLLNRKLTILTKENEVSNARASELSQQLQELNAEKEDLRKSLRERSSSQTSDLESLKKRLTEIIEENALLKKQLVRKSTADEKTDSEKGFIGRLCRNEEGYRESTEEDKAKCRLLSVDTACIGPSKFSSGSSRSSLPRSSVDRTSASKSSESHHERKNVSGACTLL